MRCRGGGVRATVGYNLPRGAARPLLLNGSNGGVAEWLGSGLQNRARQFNSARRLTGVFPKGSAECSRKSSGMEPLAGRTPVSILYPDTRGAVGPFPLVVAV